MHYPESKGRAARGGAWTIFITVLLIAPARSQDVSHLERNLDDMQYRLGQIEGEMGKLKKTASQPGPAAKAVRSRADSLLPSLIARYDSLAARVAALEAAARARAAAPSPASPAPDAGNPKVTGAPSVASAPGPARLDADTAAQGEIAALRKEMRELTALLQAARSAPPPPAPRPVATAATTASPSGSVPAPAPAAPALPPALALVGDVQIQGERRFATGSKQDNLDNFWGRVNIGTEYKGPTFQSKVNLRIYPEGFGFEPLTGATFDTTGQGALKTQTQPSSKLLVNHA